MAARCEICDNIISPERIVAFLDSIGKIPNECESCSTTVRPVGAQIFPHKTGSECMLIDPSNKEHMRLMDRYNRRAR